VTAGTVILVPVSAAQLFFSSCADQLQRLTSRREQFRNETVAQHNRLPLESAAGRSEQKQQSPQSEVEEEREPPALDSEDFLELLHCAHKQRDAALENHINPQVSSL